MENFRTFDLLDRLISKFPKEDALVSKVHGEWKKISTQQYINSANNISAGLLAAGIKKGDNVGTISNNRFEWNFVDMGLAQIGAVHVPIYPTISEHDLEFIISDADLKLFFVSTEEIYQKVNAIVTKLNKQISIYTFNEVKNTPHWTDIENLGKKNKDDAALKNIKQSIKDTDLLTILYTSGTTGNPKGVMLSHKNIISNCLACQTLAPFNHTWRALSFLPINHVYERMLTYLYQYFGISVYYAESIDAIADNLKEIKPQVFVTVPRLLEKVYDKIVAKGNELTGLKKALFFWALKLGHEYELEGKGLIYHLQLSLANKLIFSKWREALGGNIVAVASGGAALQPRLARVFNAAKITVLEGYGLTETSPVIAVNNFLPGGICFGTVGPVIQGVTVKLADDGEILIKGPNLMLGYYKRTDLTTEVIDNEGFFHTGDIGEFVNDKYLKITDRKKEIFKTSGGKYIAPQMIENKLKESRFIEQVMVIGENEKFPAAFIVPSFAFLKEYCQRKNIAYTNNEQIIKEKEIIDRITEEVAQVNKSLGSYEQVKKFELLPTEWSIDGGELTPKLSLKRKAIIAKNKTYYQNIYH
ncbi:MAG: long-chain fatty acid--CoA ligase [Bacteroidia bacterium]|nr:long-chain fatty acid--CoA ligase [Bacteroidia bacterium]